MPPLLSGLRTAGLHVVQQAYAGVEPVLDWPELSAAKRDGKKMCKEPTGMASIYSGISQNDKAALMALFSLAVRQSTPFAAGDGPASAFCSIRQGLCKHFSQSPTQTAGSPQMIIIDQAVYDFLAPALLRTDALQCYSRLLAEAAEQLVPAAGRAACGQQADGMPAGGEDLEELRATPAEAGPGSKQGPPGQDQHPAEAGVEQPRRSGAWRPGPQDLETLLHEVLHVVGVLGYFLVDKEPAATSGETMQRYRATLQSSCMLEHWARVLLLGCKAFFGEEGQQRMAQAFQVKWLEALLAEVARSQVSSLELVQRPWGCTLAATHMARLCAALDGGHAFGLPELHVLCLPACAGAELLGLSRYDTAAYWNDVRLAGQSVSSRVAAEVLDGWLDFLMGQVGKDPRAQAVPQDRRSGGGGHEEQQEQQQQGGSPDTMPRGGAALEGNGGGATEPHPAGAGLHRLPPFNRLATAALCLRLAKGVLASWGCTLPRVQRLVGNAAFSDAVRLSKLGCTSVLQQALACARFALLPDVWGKEQVPRRTRAQLREWWETYVAAAQHPEALLVGEITKPPYPGWTTFCLGPGGGPSADAAAAIEAGLLPCMTRLVTRMGAGSGGGGGAVWCPPDRSFPGMDYCWEHLVAYSPLGQVGELLSALGRRLRLAVEELRRAVARAVARNPAAAGGRGVGWLSEVAKEVMKYSRSRLWNVMWTESDGLAGTGCSQHEGLAAEVGAGAQPGAEAGPSAPPAGPRSEPSAVRLSYAAAELLPALSQGVLLGAEVGPAPGWDAMRESAGDSGITALVNFCLGGIPCASIALACCNLLLVKHIMAALDEEAAGVTGGSTGGGCDAGTGPWRQLLLRDVRLMELLGAAVRLLRWQARVGGVWAGQGQDVEELRYALCRTLPLAAATFPAEFRVAEVGGGEDTAAAAGSGSRLAEGEERACAGAGGSVGRLAGTAQCTGLAAVREALGGSGAEHGEEQQLGVVTRVLGGWEPTLQDLAELAGEYCYLGAYKDDPEDIEALLRALESPGEARRQVAAAVAAGAARQGA